jgi:glycogen(starch) synthase
VITYVGRLTIQKGLTHLFRAAAESLKRHPKTILLLIGSGEQRDELIRLGAHLGIADRVFFADFQRGKQLRDAFKVADLFVMPSVSEPFGLVALEAVGYGTPVLVSKQSGVSETLSNCLKVDYWDINEMANQIIAVLDNQVLGDELSWNAAFEFSRLSWHQSADKVMNIYHAHTGAVA